MRSSALSPPPYLRHRQLLIGSCGNGAYLHGPLTLAGRVGPQLGRVTTGLARRWLFLSARFKAGAAIVPRGLSKGPRPPAASGSIASAGARPKRVEPRQPLAAPPATVALTAPQPVGRRAMAATCLRPTTALQPSAGQAAGTAVPVGATPWVAEPPLERHITTPRPRQRVRPLYRRHLVAAAVPRQPPPAG